MNIIVPYPSRLSVHLSGATVHRLTTRRNSYKRPLLNGYDVLSDTRGAHQIGSRQNSCTACCYGAAGTPPPCQERLVAKPLSLGLLPRRGRCWAF